jgi:hypothetical protein
MAWEVELTEQVENWLLEEILLVAGSKVGRWKAWYAEKVPIADAAFTRHVRSMQHEQR